MKSLHILRLSRLDQNNRSFFLRSSSKRAEVAFNKKWFQLEEPKLNKGAWQVPLQPILSFISHPTGNKTAAKPNTQTTIFSTTRFTLRPDFFGVHVERFRFKSTARISKKLELEQGQEKRPTSAEDVPGAKAFKRLEQFNSSPWPSQWH